jgi:cell wall-associated NlpC family hydrolase
MNRQTIKTGLFLIIFFSIASCGLFKKTSKLEEADTKVTNMVIRSARKYIGTPYKYGGRDRFGMDCSGLVCTAFQESGLTLPRTSTEQAKLGKDVPMPQIQKGDLVFFATQKGSRAISHSGVVTEVKNSKSILFVHAANSGVKESNLFEEYYKKAFVKATRPYSLLK